MMDHEFILPDGAVSISSILYRTSFYCTIASQNSTSTKTLSIIHLNFGVGSAAHTNRLANISPSHGLFGRVKDKEEEPGGRETLTMSSKVIF